MKEFNQYINGEFVKSTASKQTAVLNPCNEEVLAQIPEGSVEDAKAIYKSFYKDAKFTFVADDFLHMKQVVNTNKCLVHLHKHNGKLLITSVIDNLLKGASGQAVQNMNLMFDLEEATGLGLKATYF